MKRADVLNDFPFTFTQEAAQMQVSYQFYICSWLGYEKFRMIAEC